MEGSRQKRNILSHFHRTIILLARDAAPASPKGFLRDIGQKKQGGFPIPGKQLRHRKGP